MPATVARAVLNAKHGGFGLSDEAIALLWSKHRVKADRHGEVRRNLKALVEILGEKSSGEYASLVVVKLRPGHKYVIYKYDGLEWIAEHHRTYDTAKKRWGAPPGIVVQAPKP